MPYSDDQITNARVFYKTFLDQNNLPLGEHSSVLALAAYLEENDSTEKNKGLPVKETDEFKQIEASLEAKLAEHDTVLKQRDHNWNELQKANTKVKELEAKVVTLTKPTTSGSAA